MTILNTQNDDPGATDLCADGAGVPTAALTRPCLGEWVELHTEPCRDSRGYRLAVNRRDGHAIELDEDEFALCGELDGNRPVDGAVAAELLGELWRNGYLSDRPASLDAVERRTLTQRLATAIATLDIHWNGADRAVACLYRNGGRLAFHPIAVTAQVVLAVLGVIALLAVAGDQPLRLRASVWDVPLLIMIDVVAITVHESAHALVIHRHGRKLQSAGLRLHLGVPAFYVESVDALLLTRRQRMIQAAAGPWAEWLVTSLVAVVLWRAPGMAVSVVLCRFVILNTLTIVSNLAPFSGLDGYLLLADAVREPDLARSSRQAFRELATSFHDRRRPRRGHALLACYAALNCAFAGFLFVLAVFFWYQLFGDMIHGLLGHGPAGWVIVVTAVAVLARPTVVALTRWVTALGARIRYLSGRVRFRLERRWRVDTVRRLRGLPEFSHLEDPDLGVVAGRLQRMRFPDAGTVIDPDFDGLVFVRAGHVQDHSGVRRGGACWWAHPGDLRTTCGRGADLVLVPRSSLVGSQAGGSVRPCASIS